MVASGVTTTRPQDNHTFTRLTRNDEKDDWLKRGVRSDAADLYRQQDLNVTLEHDYWGFERHRWLLRSESAHHYVAGGRAVF
ncbi:hypothetical protein ACVXHB_05970 [Escherichia coli]